MKIHKCLVGTLVGGGTLLMLLSMSCKTNSISSTTNASNDYITQTIDAKGGEIDGPNGIVVKFPAGAVQQPQAFSIGTVAEFPMPPGVAASDVFSLKPHGFLFGGPVSVSVPLLGGDTSGEIFHASCDPSDTCPSWDTSPIGGVTFEPDPAGGPTRAVFTTPSFSLYMVVQGGGSGDGGGSTDASLGHDSSGPDTGGPATCNAMSVSAGTCFQPSNVTCTGIGTASCSCTTVDGPSCDGTGAGHCQFTWMCDTADAGGIQGGCSWSTVDGGAGPQNGFGGSGSCTTICATQTSAVQAMASATQGCGYFTGP